MPLVSHGGSVMITVMIGFGLLMSVHVHRDISSARRATQPEPLPPRLARAYRLTRYQAAGRDIRIGRRSPEAQFSRLGARGAVLVTAGNRDHAACRRGGNVARAAASAVPAAVQDA